ANSKRENDKGEYAVTLMFSPTANFDLLVKACKDVAAAKYPNGVPQSFKWPLRKCKDIEDKNGNKRYGDEFDEYFQVRANTFSRRPGIVDQNLKRVDSSGDLEDADSVIARIEEEAYTGRHARMSVTPKTYDTDGNRGVKLYLNNIQLLDHDERLGGMGGTTPEDDFGAPVGAGDAAASSDSLFE
ncbi:MAG TPA: ssDNA-binding protein, partial [Alphaproteobacteria bacterium]|nr:ssDNA-binding protein [Alphaproteobacteria bacterium]